jgi:hypothetical protein
MVLACRSDGGERRMADETSSAAEREESFNLDLANRSVTKPIGAELADVAPARFVEIDIADVVNPKRIRLTFEVHYQPGNGEKLLLGSFALYPPDNPGKFIVATGGRLRSGGAIVLSMQVLDEVVPEDRVRVTVRRISFRRE